MTEFWKILTKFWASDQILGDSNQILRDSDQIIEILRNLNKFSKNSRLITAIFQKNLGFIKSCNKALYAAKGKYILRLDADDWLHPNAIEIMYNYLERNKKAEFVFPDYYEVDQKGKIISHIKRHDFKSVKLLDQPAHGACAPP